MSLEDVARKIIFNPAIRSLLMDAPIYDANTDEVIMPRHNFTGSPNWTPHKRISSDNVADILDSFNKVRMNLNGIPLVNGEFAKEVIACSGAKVIVITAKASALKMFQDSNLLGIPVRTENSDYDDTKINLYTQNIGGIDRLIFNARYRQSVAYKRYFACGSEILRRVREVLR